jgi:mono/diheme cytochrome c family protein
LLVAGLVLGFYTTVAHIIPQLQSEVAESVSLGANLTPEALVAAGEKIYHGAGGCITCHGLGTRAPNLLTDHAGEGAIGARCGRRKPGMDCKAYLYESLTQPAAYVVKGFEPIMPDMRRQLTEEQIWSVIAFLQSQGGEVTVTPQDLASAASATASPTTAASATPGTFSTTSDPKAIMREQGCLGCHKLGSEGMTIGPSFDHVGSHGTRDYIRTHIVDPSAKTAKGYEKLKGVMPTFFGQKLSAAQLEILVNFLASQK